MISVQEAEEIHKLVIERFGGAIGIRDHSALDSALARPFQTFSNQDLHSSVMQKAASLIESILINHPFIDGNKRTGYVLLRMFLLQNDFDIKATQNEKYEFVIRIASGDIKFEQIVIWLENHTSHQ